MATSPVFAADISIRGRVLDETSAAVSSALIRFHPVAGTNGRDFRASSGPTGKFEIRLPAPGNYTVTVEHEGFFPLQNQTIAIGQTPEDVHLVLNHLREVFQSVRVNATTSSLDPERTENRKSLNNLTVLNVPFSGRDLRNALKLMPGVVQDPKGGLHLSGSSSNQVLYTLDGFNITDPLTGHFDTRLSLDSVRAIDYSTGRYSPEYGKGSAGAVAIQTGMGTDTLRYSATNFVPGVDTQSGAHIGTWAPRVGLSGPILKHRAWFSDTADSEYSQTVVPDVQKGHDRTPSFRFDNLLHTQVDLSRSNIFYASFLMNLWKAPGWGLSALDPPSTTLNRRSRTWFYSFKDQMYLSRGTLLELGYAEDRTFARQIPQGNSLYLITPEGRNGNYYMDTTQTSGRRQLLANLFLPVLHLGGEHKLKTGFDFDRLDYWQDIRRTGFEQFHVDGSLLRETTYRGSGRFSRPGLEASSYLVDDWKVRSDLVLELGVRQDWDEFIRRTLLSPRLSFSYSPFRWKNTKLSGGYAVIYDSSQLELFRRPLDQIAVTTTYNPDGSIFSGPALEIFTLPNSGLKAPKYRNWTFSVDQRLPRNVMLSSTYLRKRGVDGFTYLDLRKIFDPAIDSLLTLTNERWDDYDSAEVALHQSFGKGYEWMASYTRSRAISNAVLNLAVDDTTQVRDNAGPMPWDSPNRFLGWGYFPSPWKTWAFATLVEARNGFPFSIQRDDGGVVGAVDSHRFPRYFDLDFHVEHRLHIGKYHIALRGGFTNITNHKNPTVVNNIIGAPQYMQYFGSEGRHLIFRIRWIGKDLE
ncbi:MAG TPA: TonB-dependent receptor [Bryobacteraceae bacterium]|nr:TonB-dependent receptor [Bryobacteraceae bacterium]